MFADGRIPLWIVATVAGMGVIAVVGIFFYGAYAGVGSGMQNNYSTSVVEFKKSRLVALLY